MAVLILLGVFKEQFCMPTITRADKAEEEGK